MKKFLFSKIRTYAYLRAVPPPREGRFAIVTSVGSGMRWTRLFRQTSEMSADGEVVWCQCRRFEVPAEAPRVRNWNFKSKAALEILILLAPFAFRSSRKWMLRVRTNFGKLALAVPKAGISFADWRPSA